MSTSNELYYLTRKEIDDDKWDNCIRNADNGLIYAYTFYLDAMCTQWSAIVLNDYEAVMPLPWRKKWGVRYVYQPAFIQRLGVVGNHKEAKTVFYKHVSKRFPLLHYNVSDMVDWQKATIKKRENLIINLNRTYNEIASAYTEECINNINKAAKRGCRFSDKIAIDDVINCFINAYGHKNPQLNMQDYSLLHSLLQIAKQKNAVELCGVRDEGQKLIYCAAILKDIKRLYYIVGAPTEEGRQKRATYFFIDHILKSNAEKQLLFDFEGSDIPSVAAFYKKFGPETEYFYKIKISKLLLI